MRTRNYFSGFYLTYYYLGLNQRSIAFSAVPIMTHRNHLVRVNFVSFKNFSRRVHFNVRKRVYTVKPDSKYIPSRRMPLEREAEGSCKSHSKVCPSND